MADNENDAEKDQDQDSRKGSKTSKTSKEEEPPPKKRLLFLLEFLVDTVTIDPSLVDEEVLEAQTCMTFKFLNFPPMDICEKDFDPDKEHGLDKIRFNSGKSLMFAFSEDQCENPPPIFVEVSLNKKIEKESETERIKIGSIKICMVELFRQAYEVAKYTPDRLPFSKSIKDCFMLVGAGRRTVGDVGVYIRLTCLGQNVVTEFQFGSDMKDPVLFKSRESKKVFQLTGNDLNPNEDEDRPGAFKEGCGCLGPPPPPKNRGGQGDAGRVFAQGNRVVLDVPDKSQKCQGGHNVDRVKVSGNNKGYQVTQDSLCDNRRTKDGLTVTQLNADPDKNVFVLKVGDKGQIPDRGKMILEFVTPKQKMLPKALPPYHEDIAVQTDSAKKAKKKKR